MDVSCDSLYFSLLDSPELRLLLFVHDCLQSKWLFYFSCWLFENNFPSCPPAKVNWLHDHIEHFHETVVKYLYIDTSEKPTMGHGSAATDTHVQYFGTNRLVICHESVFPMFCSPLVKTILPIIPYPTSLLKVLILSSYWTESLPEQTRAPKQCLSEWIKRMKLHSRCFTVTWASVFSASEHQGR